MASDDPKYTQLLAFLKTFQNVAVAFSGGVDSTLLLFAAHQALGDKALALTVDAPYVARWELAEAAEFCRTHGIRHQIVAAPFLEALQSNPIDRCYVCKHALFGRLIRVLDDLGAPVLMDGSNADDLADYRPGRQALAELKVRSPLEQCGLTKADIRRISKQLSLPTWNKPAYACLLTRFPHQTTVTPAALERIEKAETYLIDRGFALVRVRSHGDLARIEIGAEQIQALTAADVAADLVAHLKSLGFKYVTLDLQGYESGSFNPEGV